MNIREFAKIVHQNAADKGFYTKNVLGDLDINIDQKLLLAVGELIEAQECLRSGRSPGEVWYRPSDGKPEGFGVELADAAIRIFDLAEALGIDIEYAMLEKHAFNSGRPFRHGRAF